MPKLPRARSGSPVVIDWAVWNSLCDMVERAANLNVAAPLQLSDSGAGRTLYIDLPRMPVSVRLDANAAGDGAYLGWVLGQPTTAPGPTSPISDTSSGVVPISTDYNALIFNRQERGQSPSHDLTQSPVKCKDFFGFTYGQSTTDGKLICYLNGFDAKDCTTTPGGDFAPAEDPSVYHGTAASSAVSVIASR
jgi:hypothetical protein